MESVTCIFCKVVQGDLPAEVVYEDEHILAFKDLYPKASVHVLVIPKRHIVSLAHVTPEDAEVLAHLTLKLKDIAHSLGLAEGFQTKVHTGTKGGQEVFHLHYHILGG